MIRVRMFLMLSLLVPVLATAGPAELRPKKTYAVITGVLEWQSKTLSSFSKENRRDQGLYDTLKARGVPEENMTLLLGKDATNAKMLAALETTARKAPKGATLIFYYAGHGYPGSKGIYFASYDAGTKKVPEGFLLNDITTILKKNYRGANVLLFADCCYSGGLADVAKDLSKAGFKAGSLSSASNVNASTSWWTFTCALIDALAGRSLVDLDGDGYISMEEAGKDVSEAMLMIEMQRNGYSAHGMDGSFRLGKVNPKGKRPGDIPKPFRLGQYVTIKGRRGKTAGRIVGAREKKLRLEVQQYHSRRTEWLSADAVTARERPKLAELPKRPEPLSAELAAKKATVNGKYRKLLKKIRVEHDYVQYGAFSDYGIWKSTNYSGYQDLPAGYWVYVYPNWYIFKETTTKPGSLKKND